MKHPTNKTGAQLIADERQRQIDEEGFTAERDDEYHKVKGILTRSALTYAIFATSSRSARMQLLSDVSIGTKPRFWMFDLQWFKPGPDHTLQSRIRELTKAGALIAAEIDKMQREVDSAS